jgi:hypothetical protein
MSWRVLAVHGVSADADQHMIPSVDVASALQDAPNCVVGYFQNTMALLACQQVAVGCLRWDQGFAPDILMPVQTIALYILLHRTNNVHVLDCSALFFCTSFMPHGLAHTSASGSTQACMQVNQLVMPTLNEVQQAMNNFAPNILYIWAGSNCMPDESTCPLQNLVLGGEDELLAEDLPELVSGLHLHAIVLNMMADSLPITELQQHVPHVVRWKPGVQVHMIVQVLSWYQHSKMMGDDLLTMPHAASSPACAQPTTCPMHRWYRLIN